MLFALLACVTAESFPQMYADESCAWRDACGIVLDDCAAVVEADARAHLVDCSDDFDDERAATCLDQIRTDIDEGQCADVWPSCNAMYCG